MTKVELSGKIHNIAFDGTCATLSIMDWDHFATTEAACLPVVGGRVNSDVSERILQQNERISAAHDIHEARRRQVIKSVGTIKLSRP